MATTKAPQTHSQPSRRSKTTWRKNVDITEIQSCLETARDEQTLTGGKIIAEVNPESLFQTDTTGSVIIRKQYRNAHPTLKTDEILTRRSAVPAINSRKRVGNESGVTDGVMQPSCTRRRMGGVSVKEFARLKQIAYDGQIVHKDIVQAVDTPGYDLWDVIRVTKHAASFLDMEQPVREPKTLKHLPVSLAAHSKPIPYVRRPDPGRSYNPAFLDWTALLDRECEKEVGLEKRRVRETKEEESRLVQTAVAAQEANNYYTGRHKDGSEYEREWEGILSDGEQAQPKKKRPERKTPAQRNKIKRRKEAEKVARHEMKMRQREEQAKHIATIKEALDAQVSARSQADHKSAGIVGSDESDRDEKLRRRRFGRWAVPEASLALVLTDELQDSLRLLKPEGNLLKDRFRNMMVQGRVEARQPIHQPKKKNVKATEKWTYKDWQLRGNKLG